MITEEGITCNRCGALMHACPGTGPCPHDEEDVEAEQREHRMFVCPKMETSFSCVKCRKALLFTIPKSASLPECIMEKLFNQNIETFLRLHQGPRTERTATPCRP